MGPPLLEGLAGKWYGGLLGIDGSIYGMPCNADAVLKITPGTGESGPCEGSDRGPAVSTIGSLELGGWKYHGGMSSVSKDVIYAVPMHADRVLAIVPATGQVLEIGEKIDCGEDRFLLPASLRVRQGP